MPFHPFYTPKMTQNHHFWTFTHNLLIVNDRYNLVVSVGKDSNGPTGTKLNSNCGGSGNQDTVQISI